MTETMMMKEVLRHLDGLPKDKRWRAWMMITDDLNKVRNPDMTDVRIAASIARYHHRRRDDE